MRNQQTALLVWAAGVKPLKKHRTADATARKKATSAGIVSFYRHYARRCEAAARNAPNDKMRAELSKMVHVWREFAAEHEQMAREGRDLGLRCNHPLKGWM